MDRVFARVKGLFGAPSRRARMLERRRLKRLPVHQLFECRDGTSVWELRVIDVSFGGFRVLSPEPLGERGKPLHLRRLSTEVRALHGAAYSTGVMVEIAWSRPYPHAPGLHEHGLTLVQAPGSMNLDWYRQLLKELGLDGEAIFDRRRQRRFRCSLPGRFLIDAGLAAREGVVGDLSLGGALWVAEGILPVGSSGSLGMEWGERRLDLPVKVTGTRRAETTGRWLHSLELRTPLGRERQFELEAWLQELDDVER